MRRAAVAMKDITVVAINLW